MAEWTTRLTPLLGAVPTDATHKHLKGLVQAGVREDTDLDFKRALYGGGDSDKREMAADIAALANERGGVLILGVKDQDGVAVDLPGVELSESEILRMKSSAASLHAPHVPFDVVPVEHETRPGLGFFLLVVPPSAWRPHAVRNGERDLRYARRDGPRKRWMAESEVADMYRNRFLQASEQVDRLSWVIEEGFAGINLVGDLDKAWQRKRPWLAVGLVPNNPGSMALNLRTVGEYNEWLTKYEKGRIFERVFQATVRAGSGVRRVTATYAGNDTGQANDAYAELHTDGSGFVAMPTWWHYKQVDEPYVIDADLIFAVVPRLRFLADHAARTGAYGEAVVEVQLRTTGSPVMLAAGVTLAQFGEIMGPDRNITLDGRIVSRHTVSLDDLTGAESDLLAATRLTLTEVFQAFGTAELRQLTPDGEIRIRYWSATHQNNLQKWAEEHNVAITSEDP